MRKVISGIVILFIFFINTCSKKDATGPTEPFLSPTITPTSTLSPIPTFTPYPYGKIVYASNTDGDYDIYIFKFSDYSITNITNNTGFDSYPCWLLNGSQIFFVTDRSIGFGYDIYCMNEDGSNAFERVGTSTDKYYPRKAMINESKEVYYHKYNSTISKYEICVYDYPANREVVVLSSTGVNYQWCDYSYFTNKIAYVSDSTGYKEIYIANPDGTNVVQLTNAFYTNTQPKFSKYGEMIVYSADSNYDNKGEIWVMNSDGTNKRQITSNSEDDRLPCFSPDGYWILYVKYNSSGNGDLYIKPANGTGTEQKILGVSNINETYPDWFIMY